MGSEHQTGICAQRIRQRGDGLGDRIGEHLNEQGVIEVLAQLDQFVAINSAIEVDLTGQIGAEVIDGKYIGATGGQVDFTRGALESKGGRSIVALPSTAKRGQLSRIVVNLQGPATSLRTDADVVVTEWGSAQLKGQTLQERVKRMIAIAHPEHRERLAREVYEQGLR